MDNNQNNQGQQSNYYDSPYSQPTYSQQPVNNGSGQAPEALALAAMICGIAGFFTGPAVSIAALVIANMFKNKNNGEHVKKSRIGFRCGLGSLIMWGVIILVYVIVYCAIIMAALNS